MSNTIQHSTYTMILLLGALYAALFLGVGEFLWRKNEKLPAGILYFLFIAAVGFIVMDIEKMIDKTASAMQKMLDSAAMERSVNPSVGGNFDVSV